MAITDDVDNEERNQLLVNEASLKFYNILTSHSHYYFPAKSNLLFGTF